MVVGERTSTREEGESASSDHHRLDLRLPRSRFASHLGLSSSIPLPLGLPSSCLRSPLTLSASAPTAAEPSATSTRPGRLTILLTRMSSMGGSSSSSSFSPRIRARMKTRPWRGEWPRWSSCSPCCPLTDHRTVRPSDDLPPASDGSSRPRRASPIREASSSRRTSWVGHAATSNASIRLNSRPTTRPPTESIRLSTTVATNALLERKGSRTALFVTRGFKVCPLLSFCTRNPC